MGLFLLSSQDGAWASTYDKLDQIKLLLIQITLSYMESFQWMKKDIECPLDIDFKNGISKGMDEEFVEEQKKILIQFLSSCSQQDKWSWSEPPLQLFYFGLGGLDKFVSHPEDTGYFSVGDLMDILEFFDRVHETMEGFLDSEQKMDIENLIAFIKKSYTSKSYLYFC
jgi:hypothetical protein